MTSQPIILAGASLVAMASGALYWPERELLCVADLHLGRSERLARRGGTLLPPYETSATLDRLADEIKRLRPTRVVCLGDSFDDNAASQGLAEPDRSRLATLMAGSAWTWVAGNHDPVPVAIGGTCVPAAVLDPLCFRHAAQPDARPGEVSGHYHPKIRLPLGRRAIARRCFLHDSRRVILPAFGAYTGGLRADEPAFASLLGADARAILTGDPCVTLPLAPAIALAARGFG